MPKLDKKIQKAVDSIVEYKMTVQPNSKQIHKYVRAYTLLDILLPTTAQKAWREIDQKLELHHIQTYR